MELNLEEFVKSYVEAAFNAVRVGEPCDVDRFQESIFRDVSKKTNLSFEFLLYMHHAFHWSFFTLNPESPFSYNFPKNEKPFVLIERDNQKERKKMREYILKRYLPYLKSRAENYVQD